MKKKEKPSEETLEILKTVAMYMRGNARLYWRSAHCAEGTVDTKSMQEELAHMYCREANALREVLLYLGVRDLPPEPMTLDEVKS